MKGQKPIKFVYKGVPDVGELVSFYYT